MDRVPAFGLRLLSLAGLASLSVAAHAIVTPDSVRYHLDLSTLSRAEGVLQPGGLRFRSGVLRDVGGFYGAPESDLVSLSGGLGPIPFAPPEPDHYPFGAMQGDDLFYRFADMRSGIPGPKSHGADKGGIVMLAVTQPDALDMTSLRLGAAEAPLDSDRISISGVPEPAGWALVLLGFGLVGAGVRARRRAVVLA